MSGGELDGVTTLAMELCVSRHDASVSGRQFMDIIRSFARAIVDEIARPPAINGVDGDAIIAQHDERAGSVGSGAEPSGDQNPTSSPRVNDNAKYGKRLGFDDRTRIRMRYQAAIEGRQRAPMGFVAGLAIEYGVSDQTIIAIGRNHDG